MSKIPLLCGAALVASLAACIAVGARAEESGIPNLMSFDFGWQPASGLNFLPVEGKVAPVGRGPAQQGVERLSDAENPNLKPWAAAQIRMHNELVKNGHRAFGAVHREPTVGAAGDEVRQFQLLPGVDPPAVLKPEGIEGPEGGAEVVGVDHALEHECHMVRARCQHGLHAR